jgi:hypothetical protein
VRVHAYMHMHVHVSVFGCGLLSFRPCACTRDAMFYVLARSSDLLLGAFQRQILPQLTRLELGQISPGYLPSSLPALKSLVVACAGDDGTGMSPCQVRQYPREVTTLGVSCNHCSLRQLLRGGLTAAKAGLQLRELMLSAEVGKPQPPSFPDAAFEELAGMLEKVTIHVGKVRTQDFRELSDGSR